MVQDALTRRIRKLNEIKQDAAKPVLYIMSRDQRVQDNHALIAAQKHAQANDQSVIVAFMVYPKTGYRVLQQYEFMFEGLTHIKDELEALNIPFIVRMASKPSQAIEELVSDIKPGAIYFDFNPLRGPQALRKKVANSVDAACYEVDTHNVVPVWITSDQQEFAAHTIRGKIHSKFGEFIEEPDLVTTQEESSEEFHNDSLDAAMKSITAKSLGDQYSPPFASGETAAHETLQIFLKKKLKDYATKRNDPTLNKLTNLSPYLHFGQISSLRVVLELKKLLDQSNLDLHAYSSKKMPKADLSQPLRSGADALFEELVVRKELADNFCYYNSDYDQLDGAKKWALITLQKHQDDPREHIYPYTQLEKAQTHDQAWNAAQNQLLQTGKIHGYMRMYWAKKILEWTKDPQTALDWTNQFNDTYSLDGGDPNGYTGVMWSIAGIHDRPWMEREVFGQIRYMNQKGLRRKFDIDKYIRKFS
ncbi:TPA: deoxyribodipyrimidine photolyase [Candidatus Saccharibacteria bacterium]|nr:deoxyribodipyrimidine photolyase [Candidatus Saccharibacteria bacterium]HIO87636.1 deoxyribodipyrimidine photolyase [Candidatus Saccharibacteria bacterium]